MKKHFKPEFLNRLDDTVIFKPLDKEALHTVIGLEVQKLKDRLEKKDIHIRLSDEAIDFLSNKGFQPEMGARPIRRVLEEYLEDPIAEYLLHHPNEGRQCDIDYEKGKDELTFHERSEEASEEMELSTSS